MRDFNPTPTPTPIKINRVQQCPYCKNYKGDPGIVWPEDKLATKQPDGSYKCGPCNTFDLRKRMLRVLGPNNERVKEFLQEEQREVIRWNRYADNINKAAGTQIMEKKRNKYLEKRK